MKKLLLLLILGLGALNLSAQKKVLTHDVYDGWKNLRHQQISNDGNWISYEINPQQGDGFLYLYNVKKRVLDSIARGYEAKFTSDSKLLTYKIRVQYDTLRKAKLKKVKKEKLPKDSLAIWNLTTNKITKYPNVKSIKIPKAGKQMIAFLLQMPKSVKDTTTTDSVEKKQPKAKKNKKKIEKIGQLSVYNYITKKIQQFDSVTDYHIARNGTAVVFSQLKNDTVTKLQKVTLNNSHTIFEKKGTLKQPILSPNGKQLAFLFSADTTKHKCFDLYYGNEEKSATVVVDTLNKNIEDNYSASENGKLYFSQNNKKLYFGVAPKPVKAPKDTLLEEEKYHVDVWNWKDPLLQTQQKHDAEEEKKRTYLSVYYPASDKVVQLADKQMPNVRTFNSGNKLLALGSSSNAYQQLESWDDWYNDYFLVNTLTGKRELILTKKNSVVSISPAQKYLYWYETRDSIWYAYQIKTRKTIALTKSIPVNFYNEIYDRPSDIPPYGIAGWTKNDESIIIKDCYDLWQIDLANVTQPKNITNGYGRKNSIRFSYKKLDKKQRFIDLKQKNILSAFNEKSKESGVFLLNKDGNPKLLTMQKAQLKGLQKAKNSDAVIFTKGTFRQYPDLWTSKLNFKRVKQISNTNPQQKNYWWGDVELVHWTSGDGDELSGLLYKPENFDPNKKYPMLVYFYERLSDRLYRHHVPQPNWSIIIPSYCVSNGYVVFMPDITYKNKVGFPGEAAYSAVVSGTLAMADRYPFIDKNNMGIQGQSWGGYQTAYLVTRTNLFKCAMAGAPVSNMTSAYGGIRWESGCSRMFQYERTQSRIGGTLWNKTLQYIENSPLFFAPKVKTPLLIMHNDKDGAVPWYQGIELFVSLRRLQKPCWMLTYNNDYHNLRRRANRKDLAVRMMQFFDYYLKGTKEPVWMKRGIPAVDKDKKTGYELE